MILIGRDEDRTGEVFVQVAAADARPGNLDRDVSLALAGLRDFFDADVLHATPTCCFHLSFLN